MSHLNHDTAARLIGISPGELESLVKAGAVRRVDRNAYALPVLLQDYIGHVKAERDRVEFAPKQTELAAHLDLSERSVRELLGELGVDHRQSTLAEIRVAYIRKLREIAAGRAAEGGLDLAAERARLAREHADKVAMQNAVTRSELAPKRLLSDVLARSLSRIARLLDTIPGELRRRNPALTSEDIDAVRRTIAKVRNVAASSTIDDLFTADDEADAPEPPELDAAA